MLIILQTFFWLFARLVLIIRQTYLCFRCSSRTHFFRPLLTMYSRYNFWRQLMEPFLLPYLVVMYQVFPFCKSRCTHPPSPHPHKKKQRKKKRAKEKKRWRKCVCVCVCVSFVRGERSGLNTLIFYHDLLHFHFACTLILWVLTYVVLDAILQVSNIF